MSTEIRQLTKDGEVFYPLTHIDALVGNNGSGIDDKPIAGSGNLVRSGGVAEKLSELGSKDGDISLIDLNNKSLWHIGGIDSTTGKETSDNTRLKTDYIQWSHLGEWVSKSEISSFPVYCYDINKSYLGYFNKGAKTNLSSIQILYPNTFYIRLGVILNDQASVDIIGNSVILNKIYTNLQNKEIDNKIKLFKDEYFLLKKDVEQKEGGTTKLNLNDESIWHIGEISSGTGEIREKTSRLYSDLIPSIDRGLFVKEKNTELELLNYTVYCYDCTLKYLGFYAKSGNLASSLNVWDDYPNTYFIRLGVIFAESVLADLSLIGNGIILNEIYINKTMQDLLINHKSIIRDNIKYIGSPTEVNLSDVSIWHQGGIGTASGKVDTSTNRLYSEMLNVVDGIFRWYNLSNEVPIGAANIYIYDENKKYLGYKSILLLTPLKVEDLLLDYPNFMYIRFSFIALNNTELIPSMIGVDISWANVKILPYNKKTIIEQVEENTKAIEKSFSNNWQSILSGKKLVACGDSFTYGDFSTITDDKGLKGKDSPELWDSEYNCWKSYSYWVAKRNGMKYINDGIGGTTIAYIESHSAKNKAFSVQRYKNIPSDADYITLKFGINDGHQNVTLGTINDTDNTTFYGAWNVVLKYLVENFPYAKIGVIISNGLDYNELADATIECCKKWGVPYLDEVYDEKVPLLHRVNRPGVNSSVKTAKLNAFRISATDSHPNPKAHLYESTFVEDWLKSL